MLTVPEDVRRLWDSERFEFSDDDDPCELLDQVGGILIPDMDLPDLDSDDDSRTDDRYDDYRIEEALDGCPFETDNLAGQNAGHIGLENISDVHSLVLSGEFVFGLWG
jgi:hypothetical protein